MKRLLTCMFGMTVLLLLWTGKATYAQAGARQLGVSHLQNTGAHTHNAHGSSQSQAHAHRCAEGKGRRSQHIPKPEQKRFHEGTGKKVGNRRKRKTSAPSTNSKTTTTERVPERGMKEANNAQSAKRRVRKKACNVRSERIDDIPVL